MRTGRGRERLHLWNGEMLTLKEVARRSGANYSTLVHKLENNEYINVESAIQDIKRYNTFEFEGRTITRNQFEKAFRLYNGYIKGVKKAFPDAADEEIAREIARLLRAGVAKRNLAKKLQAALVKAHGEPGGGEENVGKAADEAPREAAPEWALDLFTMTLQRDMARHYARRTREGVWEVRCEDLVWTADQADGSLTCTSRGKPIGKWYKGGKREK